MAKWWTYNNKWLIKQSQPKFVYSNYHHDHMSFNNGQNSHLTSKSNIIQKGGEKGKFCNNICGEISIIWI